MSVDLGPTVCGVECEKDEGSEDVTEVFVNG